MSFNEKLVNLRKTAGLSQDALARQLGVSRQAISKWELGTAMPETENIIRISKIFGVEIDWLLEHRVLIKPNNSINYQKTIKILFVVMYIMFVCFMLISLMLFTINMADGVVDIIRPFSWLKVEEYFQVGGWVRGCKIIIFATGFLLPAGVSFALMCFIRKKDREYDIRK